MRRISGILIAVLLGIGATAHAAELTGVLVDKACYASVALHDMFTCYHRARE